MRILLLGHGLSTAGVARLLDYYGAEYDFYDKNDVVNCEYDYIVKSPGIPLDDSVFSMIRGKVISDIELVYLVAKPYVIAVTGSNGKTTCVEMLYSVLSRRYKAVKCGNIGYSFADAVLDNRDADIFIVEVSSFMLESCYYFDPDISILLNISPSHLDHHKSFESYFSSKLNICRNQSVGHYVIYNMDDSYLRDVKKYTYAKAIGITLDSTIGDIFRLGEGIYDGGKKLFNLSFEDKKHCYNLYKYISVLKVCNILHINKKWALKRLRAFKGVPYRLEKLNDYTYNDAKSTNCNATNMALMFLGHNVDLICGGYDRNMTFFLDARAIEALKRVYVYGECKNKLKNFFDSYHIPCTTYEDLKEAYNALSKERKENEIILYSPMCASFDQYSSYLERGREFTMIVNSNPGNVDK